MADDRLRQVPPRKPMTERPTSVNRPRAKGEEWLYFPRRATKSNTFLKSQPKPDLERDMNLRVLHEVPVQVSAVLGKTTMQISELLKLGRGAVVELDRRVGDPIEIYVNDRLVARGEVIVADERLGVKLTEVIKSEKAA